MNVEKNICRCANQSCADKNLCKRALQRGDSLGNAKMCIFKLELDERRCSNFLPKGAK